MIDWAEYAPALLRGALRTLSFTGASFIGAVMMGLILALARQSRFVVLRGISRVYTETIKNIPLLTGIFIIYFGLTSINIILDSFTAGCLALIIFYGSYLAEIFRGSLASVGHGQYEGASAVGLGTGSMLAKIVLPQAARVALPATGTMLIDLMKSTALLVTISGAELMTVGQAITSRTFQALQVYLVLGAIYFALCFPLSQLVGKLERTVSSGRPVMPGRRQTYRMILRKLGDKVDTDTRRITLPGG